MNKIILEALRQCRQLDKLGIEKQEMHKPIKHLIIGKGVKLIDFERAKEKKNPRNVTQFCQFLNKIGLMKRDIRLLARYKHEQNDRNFNALKGLLTF